MSATVTQEEKNCNDKVTHLNATPSVAQAVLALLVRGEESARKSAKNIVPEDFPYRRQQLIFQSIAALEIQQIRPDTITIVHELRRVGNLDEAGGPAEITRLAATEANPLMVQSYVDCFRAESQARKVKHAADEVAKAASTGGNVAAAMQTLNQTMVSINQAGCRVGERLNGVLKNLQQLSDKGTLAGQSTGLKDLDQKTEGLHPGQLIIIASRPSMGKTILGDNIAFFAASQSSPTPALFFSLEMNVDEIIQRQLSARSKVFFSKILSGRLENRDWPRLQQAASETYSIPYFIDDTPALLLDELCARARRHVAEHNVGLIVIDYLQLIRASKSDNRTEEVSQISRGLKSLAKELNVPIVALAQLNRELEKRADKRPMMSDLRESGAIEQDADLILLLYRESVYCEECRRPDLVCTKNHAHEAEIIIGKQRNGSIGIVPVEFDGATQRFVSVGYLEREHAEREDERRVSVRPVTTGGEVMSVSIPEIPSSPPPEARPAPPHDGDDDLLSEISGKMGSLIAEERRVWDVNDGREIL
jgi:replicative DNA helicase